MKVYATLDEFAKAKSGCVVTIGNFDGVHLGHQAIITRARELARSQDLPLVALTFEPSPVKILRPNRAPRILTPIQVKTRLLAEQGLDALVIISPTPAFLALSPEDFAKNILKGKLDARYVVEGQTFSFGQHGAGTLVSLAALGEQLGFKTELVPVLTSTADTTGVAFTSTLVRRHVETGQLQQARQCMGRRFALTGTIIPGRGNGGELGFPTANLRFYSPDQLVPEDGVFAALARLGNDFDTAWDSQDIHPAAVSIGRCQTFPDGQWQTEAFLLDYDSDAPSLYNKHMILSLVAKIRQQQKFDSPAALREAIADDCAQVKRTLAAI